LSASPAAGAAEVVCRGIEPAGDLQDINQRCSAVHGADADGAVLIRPDGFVAWRRRHLDGSAQAALNAALDCVLARDVEHRKERAS
jgi:putative polyketide hydroxylase